MVRSQALVYVLKAKYGMDALACGLNVNSEETKEMLMAWADKIIVLDRNLLNLIPERYVSKLILLNLGEDIWHNPGHPDLINLLDERTNEIIKVEAQA